MKAGPIAARFAAAGLFAGALAWALHQQAGYIIAAFSCARGGLRIWWVGVLALAILVAGALASWFAMRRQAPPAGMRDSGHTIRFLATIALMAAGLFLFAIALQASAVLFLAPCLS
ncbi:MAG TPA: hypothetical protein VG166_11685 [Caulobacteraceae bacterium]|jgi:hypothetical protein|nr:hypothetical protein [Caulobacteraceae bacterium]